MQTKAIYVAIVALSTNVIHFEVLCTGLIVNDILPSSTAATEDKALACSV